MVGKHNDRPSWSARLSVVLHDLKYASGMSDEAVLDEYLENPCWQYFTCEIYFEHEYLSDPSIRSRWSKKICPDRRRKNVRRKSEDGTV